MIVFNHNEIMHQLEQEAFYSRVLTLKIGKTTQKVVLKDLQRHPFKRSVLHIDLQRIDEDQKLTMRVPLHFINEETCIGVKQDGGVISHLMSEVEIVCLPKDLPEFLDIDMSEVGINETLQLKDIKLPEGIEIYSLLHGGDDAQPIVSVHIPKVSAADEAAEAAEAAEEGVETTEGTEAAEAAGESTDSPAKDDTESQDSES